MTAEKHPFTVQLLRWYDEHGRQLPWRDTKDPYRIWISEVILQQTRVAQGYDYYLRFVARFPTVEELANAHQDEVMQQWEGLGYYSRARNLHAAAQQIVEHGAFPSDYQTIRALKGVGDYTAAAIASFAFDLPTAAVDGNVYRVLARYFGIDTPIDSTAGKKIFAELAQQLILPKRAADYNQAIMDFGALQCTPKSPNCMLCPMNSACAALAEGRVDGLPVKAKKIAVTHRFLAVCFVLVESTEGRQLFVRRRHTGDIWAGLYEALTLENDSQTPLPQLSTQTPLSALLALPEAHISVLTENMRHQLTHRLIHADAYLLRIPASQTEAAQRLLHDHKLQPLTKISELPFPKMLLTMLKQLIRHES